MEWIAYVLNPEGMNFFDRILVLVKHILSLTGGLVILLGAVFAISQFVWRIWKPGVRQQSLSIDVIRLNLGRTIVLGLEFIVAADVIETTTTPDYYSVGILAILVLIRTFLSFFLSRELNSLSDLERHRLDQ